MALPADHGAWVFLLSPLLIGLFAGGRVRTPTAYLVVASMCAFLVRQPITIVVKSLSGRRSREDLAAAVFWIVTYTAIGLLHVTGLVIRGFGHLLYLAVPGVPVFVWYLYLVSRRAERRQLLVEILAAGALALSAPAAMWIGLGTPDPRGWLLWALVWAQSAASIVYAYLRLGQRTAGTPSETLGLSRASWMLASCNLAAAAALGQAGAVPALLAVPFAVQWAEVLWGTRHPAFGWKPRAVGMRQLAVSAAFTVLFIVAW